MTDQPQYDRFSPRDDEALAALLRQAFGDTRAIVAWFRAALGDDAFRILRLGDQVAAELALVPMAQWFGGQAVPVVGVSAFSVAPAFRGQGFSTKLLRAMLEEAHERDFALATLYASTLTV